MNCCANAWSNTRLAFVMGTQGKTFITFFFRPNTNTTVVQVTVVHGAKLPFQQFKKKRVTRSEFQLLKMVQIYFFILVTVWNTAASVSSLA